MTDEYWPSSSSTVACRQKLAPTSVSDSPPRQACVVRQSRQVSSSQPSVEYTTGSCESGGGTGPRPVLLRTTDEMLTVGRDDEDDDDDELDDEEEEGEEEEDDDDEDELDEDDEELVGAPNMTPGKGALHCKPWVQPMDTLSHTPQADVVLSCTVTGDALSPP